MFSHPSEKYLSTDHQRNTCIYVAVLVSIVSRPLCAVTQGGWSDDPRDGAVFIPTQTHTVPAAITVSGVLVYWSESPGPADRLKSTHIHVDIPKEHSRH